MHGGSDTGLQRLAWENPQYRIDIGKVLRNYCGPIAVGLLPWMAKVCSRSRH